MSDRGRNKIGEEERRKDGDEKDQDLKGGCLMVKVMNGGIPGLAQLVVVHYWVVFRHMVFSNGFLFPVKELGLFTNPGQWVRVLDVVGSYMYIVL
jgi:hypothetical protein